MKDPDEVVGVRELRAHLSAYLHHVARGGTVTIGDRRHRPVARLVPAQVSVEVRRLSALAERGAVRIGVGSPGAHPPIKPGKAGRTVGELVVEDRR